MAVPSLLLSWGASPIPRQCSQGVPTGRSSFSSWARQRGGDSVLGGSDFKGASVGGEALEAKAYGRRRSGMTSWRVNEEGMRGRGRGIVRRLGNMCVRGEWGTSDPVRQWITTEGGASKITKTSPVFGGCINSAAKYDTDVGPFFVKTNTGEGEEMFAAEAAGLRAMWETHTIRVPRPYATGALPRRGAFIIMEYVPFGSSSASQAELGHQLAQMHLAGVSPNAMFGFDCNNTIGSTPQINPWTSDWVTFFRDHRLGFQLQLIQLSYNDSSLLKMAQKLLDNLPALFEGVEVKPSLLHGDLWSGNIATDTSGQPVILDPATYYGHNEAEFGMSWCAGFGPSFYNAYFEVIPRQAGFEERVELYKLYHYLNHYNLFGSSYRSSCTSIISRFI